jgi:ankyrin repeat protein
MALLAEKQNDLPQALELFTRTANIYRTAYGAEHKEVLDALNQVERVQADLDNPVYAAAMQGHADVLAMLLEANADPSAGRTDNGATPVFAAARKGHADVLAMLLEANADPSAAKTDDGATPTFIAAQHGHLDVLTALVAAGASTGTVLPNGASDLWAAAWKGQTAVVRYLVNTDGVEINRSRDLTEDIPGPGTTPLQIAELDGHTECATILRAARAV